MEFSQLVDRTIDDEELKRAIDALVAAKRAAVEMDRGPRIDVISDFIEQEIVRFEHITANFPKQESSTAALNDLFRSTLEEVWTIA
jgi:predicted nucleotidyltransferase